MKKTIFLVVLVAIILSGVNAQFGNLKIVRSNNQQLIEEAIIDGLCILRQDYMLKDSINYGRGGKPYFGRGYEIGVLTSDNKILFNKNILKPWESDVNYNQYKNDTTKQPALSALNIREIKSNVYVARDRDSVVVGDSLLIATLTNDKKGLMVSPVKGKKEVWVVLLYIEKNEISRNDTATNIMFATYKKEIDFGENINRIKIDKPNKDAKYIGGVCLNPKIKSIGTIQVYLSGVVEQCGDELYVLPVTEAVLTAPAEVESDELTPIDSDAEDGTDDKGKDNSAGKKDKSNNRKTGK